MKTRIQQLWNRAHDTTMLFAFVMWLCVLPIVLLLTAPFFGWQGAVVGAVVTFVVALIACYAVCAFPKISIEEDLNVRRPRLR